MKIGRWITLLMIPVFFLQLLDPLANFVRTLAQPSALAFAEEANVKSPEVKDTAGESHVESIRKANDNQGEAFALHTHSALPLAWYKVKAPTQARVKILIWDLHKVRNFPPSVFQPPKRA